MKTLEKRWLFVVKGYDTYARNPDYYFTKTSSDKKEAEDWCVNNEYIYVIGNWASETSYTIHDIPRC